MSKKFSGQSDLDLITLYRNGNEDACTALLVRYANLINRRVSTIGIDGVDRDDLRQVAYMGLCNAIRAYDPAKGGSFQSFANVCIGNSLKNLFASATSQKGLLSAQTLSFDELEEIDLRDKTEADPELALIDRESCNELTELIGRVLSDFERNVLFSYLSGRGYDEVAAKLHSSQKSVDNALQRARRKLKAVLNEL